jgi:hypothetical protein
MESMALVLVDQVGSTKQVFLIFSPTFLGCLITVFSCHLYDDRQKYRDYSMPSLPELLKSHDIYIYESFS